MAGDLLNGLQERPPGSSQFPPTSGYERQPQPRRQSWTNTTRPPAVRSAHWPVPPYPVGILYGGRPGCVWLGWLGWLQLQSVPTWDGYREHCEALSVHHMLLPSRVHWPNCLQLVGSCAPPNSWSRFSFRGGRSMCVTFASVCVLSPPVSVDGRLRGGLDLLPHKVGASPLLAPSGSQCLTAK